MAQCLGCQANFSLSGYTTHLQRTGNEACQAIYDEQMRYHRPGLEPEEEQHPVPFGGDYFGSYQEEDFDMDQDPEPANPRGVDVDDDLDDLPDSVGPEAWALGLGRAWLGLGPGLGVFTSPSPPKPGPSPGWARAAGPDGPLLPDMADLSSDSDSDSDSEDEDFVDLERRWEPQVPDNQQFPGLEEENLGDNPPQAHGEGTPGAGGPYTQPEPNVPAREDRAAGEEQVHQQPIIVQFTDGDAGAPLRQGEPGYERYKADLGDSANFWSPFTSKLDWEVSQWAKLQGPGSTAFTDLLKIDGVTERLGLSFKNSRELNHIIDTKLPGRPRFKRKEIIVGGEAYDVYFRDILECVKALYGDPEFAVHLKVAPERHYADEDQTVRLYHDMHTGKWWWATQIYVKRELEKSKKGATIIPIIISSDKTLLTLFRNRTAYPVISVENLLVKPKFFWRKYLPTSKLEHITVKASRRRILANLFHACMSKIVEPLKVPGVHGMVVVSGDGVARRGHPILAAYVGDYPEQLLVTCVKNMECPQCETLAKELGNAPVDGEPDKFRDLEAILDVLATFDDSPAEFGRKCKAAGIKPIVHPFWEGLDIFKSITPDVLHQLYQGVMKHLKAWIIETFGSAEIDARCRRLPPNHNIRTFMNGISHLSRVTGQEHDQICRFLLGIAIDIPLPDNLDSGRLIRSIRGLLDFLYLSQYPVHSVETLSQQDDALKRFHDNKDIFIDLGIRSNFNLPKLHSLRHYTICDWDSSHLSTFELFHSSNISHLANYVP
ncbi:hypothetical protein GGX14DRAFT_398364 [Mycena pura]|uniref:Uncharacterized protein n=1 Tax=Mycena pura TaxID=153505 RepID=A0AAD6V6B7_9AGAR|nr:hypothetical protein GGX14DRAFT_398364 [Mycena pura]